MHHVGNRTQFEGKTCSVGIPSCIIPGRHPIRLWCRVDITRSLAPAIRHLAVSYRNIYNVRPSVSTVRGSGLCTRLSFRPVLCSQLHVLCLPCWPRAVDLVQRLHATREHEDSARIVSWPQVLDDHHSHRALVDPQHVGQVRPPTYEGRYPGLARVVIC